MASRSATAQPIAAINITPLIDVMLVLLIMMILTLPMMTHKVSVDLPTPSKTPMPPLPTHRLDIASSGALTLDGVAIAEADLPARLQAIREDKDSVLTINPDAASRYVVFDRVLATIKRNGISRLGFVGNAQFASAF